VAIITGAGRAFSSGRRRAVARRKGFTKIDRWRELCVHEGIRLQPTPRRMHIHKPVIAAVNGGRRASRSTR
jgi:enoyl-CoA hydratase/carnithine racemase